MKRFFLTICVFVAAIALVVIAVKATPTLVGGSPLVANNTTVNCSNAVTFLYPPYTQPFTVTHGALASTSDITINVSNTLDNVNYLYGFTWHPAFTNAGTETINPMPVTNYCRASVTTTNSQSVVITYGN